MRLQFRQSFGCTFLTLFALALSVSIPARANTYDYTFDFTGGPTVSFDSTALLTSTVDIAGDGGGITDFKVSNCPLCLTGDNLLLGFTGTNLSSATFSAIFALDTMSGLNTSQPSGGTYSAVDPPTVGMPEPAAWFELFGSIAMIALWQFQRSLTQRHS